MLGLISVAHGMIRLGPGTVLLRRARAGPFSATPNQDDANFVEASTCRLVDEASSPWTVQISAEQDRNSLPLPPILRGV